MAKIERNKCVFYGKWKGKNDLPDDSILFRIGISEQELPASIFITSLVKRLLNITFFIEGEKIVVGDCYRFRLNESENGDCVVTFKTDLDNWNVNKDQQKLFNGRLIIVKIVDLTGIEENANEKEEEVNV